MRDARRGEAIHLGDAALAFLAPILKRAGARRVTVTACGLDVTYRNAIYQRALRRGLRSVDRVVAISRATGDRLRERGVPDDRITIIPCGVWPDGDAIDHRRPRSNRLVTVGRLIPRKGVRWFLERAFPLILASVPDATYGIVGDGPDRSSIKRIVAERGWKNRVTVHGAVDERRKRELMCSSDVFVMPNVAVPGDAEGFGIVCLEAGMCGVPAAAAEIDGVSDAVRRNQTGMLFHSGDPEDCAKTIIALLRNAPDPRSIRSAVIHHYSWTTLGPRFLHAVA